jgi:hypothetical protein
VAIVNEIDQHMKQVFTNSSVIPCDLVKSMLEAEGIPAIIKNELGSAAAGYSLPVLDNPSLPWAWPEVWVPDQDCERALELISGFEAAPGGQDAQSE